MVYEVAIAKVDEAGDRKKAGDIVSIQNQGFDWGTVGSKEYIIGLIESSLELKTIQALIRCYRDTTEHKNCFSIKIADIKTAVPDWDEVVGTDKTKSGTWLRDNNKTIDINNGTVVWDNEAGEYVDLRSK